MNAINTLKINSNTNKKSNTTNMKTLKKLILVLLGLGILTVSAQDYNDDEIKTLFPKNRSNGGYGALTFSYTQIDGKDAFMMGGRGAWVIGHSFALGFGGNGFINDIDFENPHNIGGYGGLYLEPIIAPKFPVHISFPILIGGGGITNMIYSDNWEDFYYEDSSTDAYFIIEPGAELEFNLTRNMRMSLTCTYRFTTDILIQNVSPDILKGFSYGLAMKFGKF
jgi:hypothetical protein